MARDRYERAVSVERDSLTEKQKAALVSLLKARAIDSGSAHSTYLLKQKHGEQVSGNVLSNLFTRGLVERRDGGPINNPIGCYLWWLAAEGNALAETLRATAEGAGEVEG